MERKEERNEPLEGDVETVEPHKSRNQDWLRTKELEFAQKDNRNPIISTHKYMDKYVFTDLHEVFFCDFPHLL
jgi:hypothetical protein